jgi:hypothetical protein
LREDDEAANHALGVLARRGARYRFGAPLDERWLASRWSAHLEFQDGGVRVRTDFFTRPPRVSAAELERMWREQEGRDPPFTDAEILVEMKKTARAKDYPFIGELARRMRSPREQLLSSRSAVDLIALGERHPELARELEAKRPLLVSIRVGRRPLAEALQHEMLDLIEADEDRLEAYRRASEGWAARWTELARELDELPLLEAHARIVAAATGVLPERVVT